ncbi:abnormal cell migration protein 38 [Ditylenchus destructor]|nr:abnormal cell migration protein 38 [Ditylenchus destructor]
MEDYNDGLEQDWFFDEDEALKQQQQLAHAQSTAYQNQGHPGHGSPGADAQPDFSALFNVPVDVPESFFAGTELQSDFYGQASCSHHTAPSGSTEATQNSYGFGGDSQNQNAGSRSQTRGPTPSQSQIQSSYGYSSEPQMQQGGSSQGQVSSQSLQPPVFEPMQTAYNPIPTSSSSGSLQYQQDSEPQNQQYQMGSNSATNYDMSAEAELAAIFEIPTTSTAQQTRYVQDFQQASSSQSYQQDNTRQWLSSDPSQDHQSRNQPLQVEMMTSQNQQQSFGQPIQMMTLDSGSGNFGPTGYVEDGTYVDQSNALSVGQPPPQQAQSTHYIAHNGSEANYQTLQVMHSMPSSSSGQIYQAPQNIVHMHSTPQVTQVSMISSHSQLLASQPPPQMLQPSNSAMDQQKPQMILIDSVPTSQNQSQAQPRPGPIRKPAASKAKKAPPRPTVSSQPSTSSHSNSGPSFDLSSVIQRIFASSGAESAGAVRFTAELSAEFGSILAQADDLQSEQEMKGIDHSFKIKELEERIAALLSTANPEPTPQSSAAEAPNYQTPMSSNLASQNQSMASTATQAKSASGKRWRKKPPAAKNESSAASSTPLSSVQSTSRGQFQALPKPETPILQTMPQAAEVAGVPSGFIQIDPSASFIYPQMSGLPNGETPRFMMLENGQLVAYPGAGALQMAPQNAMIIPDGSAIPSTSAQPSAGPQSVPVKKPAPKKTSRNSNTQFSSTTDILSTIDEVVQRNNYATPASSAEIGRYFADNDDIPTASIATSSVETSKKPPRKRPSRSKASLAAAALAKAEAQKLPEPKPPTPPPPLILPSPAELAKKIEQKRVERKENLFKQLEALRDSLAEDDCEAPFYSKSDCIQRLLPYAFAYEPDVGQNVNEQFEHDLLRHAVKIEERKKRIEEKMRLVLMKEALGEKEHDHELAMLFYLDGEFERRKLAEEKIAATDSESFVPDYSVLNPSLSEDAIKDALRPKEPAETNKDAQLDFEYREFDSARYAIEELRFTPSPSWRSLNDEELSETNTELGSVEESPESSPPYASPASQSRSRRIKTDLDAYQTPQERSPIKAAEIIVPLSPYKLRSPTPETPVILQHPSRPGQGHWPSPPKTELRSPVSPENFVALKVMSLRAISPQKVETKNPSLPPFGQMISPPRPQPTKSPLGPEMKAPVEPQMPSGQSSGLIKVALSNSPTWPELEAMSETPLHRTEVSYREPVNPLPRLPAKLRLRRTQLKSPGRSAAPEYQAKWNQDSFDRPPLTPQPIEPPKPAESFEVTKQESPTVSASKITRTLADALQWKSPLGSETASEMSHQKEHHELQGSKSPVEYASRMKTKLGNDQDGGLQNGKNWKSPESEVLMKLHKEKVEEIGRSIRCNDEQTSPVKPMLLKIKLSRPIPASDPTTSEPKISGTTLKINLNNATSELSSKTESKDERKRRKKEEKREKKRLKLAKELANEIKTEAQYEPFAETQHETKMPLASATTNTPTCTSPLSLVPTSPSKLSRRPCWQKSDPDYVQNLEDQNSAPSTSSMVENVLKSPELRSPPTRKNPKRGGECLPKLGLKLRIPKMLLSIPKEAKKEIKCENGKETDFEGDMDQGWNQNNGSTNGQVDTGYQDDPETPPPRKKKKKKHRERHEKLAQFELNEPSEIQSPLKISIKVPKLKIKMGPAPRESSQDYGDYPDHQDPRHFKIDHQDPHHFHSRPGSYREQIPENREMLPRDHQDPRRDNCQWTNSPQFNGQNYPNNAQNNSNARGFLSHSPPNSVDPYMKSTEFSISPPIFSPTSVASPLSPIFPVKAQEPEVVLNQKAQFSPCCSEDSDEERLRTKTSQLLTKLR